MLTGLLIRVPQNHKFVGIISSFVGMETFVRWYENMTCSSTDLQFMDKISSFVGHWNIPLVAWENGHMVSGSRPYTLGAETIYYQRVEYMVIGTWVYRSVFRLVWLDRFKRSLYSFCNLSEWTVLFTRNFFTILLSCTSGMESVVTNNSSTL